MNYEQVPSPTFVLQENLLRKNLELLDYVQEKADITIILAFKGFAMWSAFPLVRKYLSGATASSLNEARLCYEEMKQKAHTYAPAYSPHEMGDLMKYSSHITFNSINQYLHFEAQIQNSPTKISCGLRVNPEYSPVETEIYNPCAIGSRLGENKENLKQGIPNGIEGLHFHALCESSADHLETLLFHFEQHYSHLLPKVKWVNMGGGHLITKNGYDVEKLISILRKFKKKYNVEIILEPGSAIAWETGVLVSTVLDIVQSANIRTAILDVSFTAHMPDTLEMPYRPSITGATDPQVKEETHKELYRLGGISCLAGDFHFEYAFPKALRIGDKIIFEDMIHYTMVKTNMFNGVSHPNIAILRENNTLDLVRKFNYNDYKMRLS